MTRNGTGLRTDLAWYVIGCSKGGTVTFNWTVDYTLQCSQQATLSNNVPFGSASVTSTSADLTKGEVKQLIYAATNYEFTDLKQPAGNIGTLGIVSNETVSVDGTGTKANDCYVAIAMDGKPISAVLMTPNTTVTFIPKPVYYLSFGTYSQGCPLGLATNNTVVPLKLDFDKLGIEKLEFFINGANEWIIP